MAATLDSLREPLECSIEAHCLESDEQVYIGKDSNGREIRSLKDLVLTPCLHVFCPNDWEDYARMRGAQCPVCRADIDPRDTCVISNFAKWHFEAITQPTRTKQDKALSALYSGDEGRLLSSHERLQKEYKNVQENKRLLLEENRLLLEEANRGELELNRLLQEKIRRLEVLLGALPERDDDEERNLPLANRERYEYLREKNRLLREKIRCLEARRTLPERGIDEERNLSLADRVFLWIQDAVKSFFVNVFRQL